MRKLPLLVISCLLGFVSQAQVKFNNPSFESDGPPPKSGTVPVGYYQCTSTPDIEPGQFCSASNGSVPPPHDGIAYVGLVNDAFGGESFGQQLSCPLISGKTYSFDLWGMSDDCTSRPPGILKVYASNTQCGTNQLVYTSPKFIKDGIWRKYTISFTASGNYSHIKFENGDASGGIGGTGIFIDDIQEVISAATGTFTFTNASCNNPGSVSFSPSIAGTFTYKLFNSAGTVISTSNPANNLAPGTYRYEAYSASDPCIPMVYNFTVSGQSAIQGVLTANDSIICLGDSALLNFAKANSSSNYSYSWSPGTGLSSTTSASPSAKPTNTITYTLTVTDLSDPTCQKNYTITINVDPVPPVPTSANKTICTGTSTTVTSTAASAGSFSWYDVQGGPMLFQQNNSISSSYNTPVLSSTKTYYIYYTTTNGCAPSGYDSIVVDVAPTLSASLLSKIDPGCSTCDGSLSIGVSGGLAPYTINWTPSGTGPNLTGLCRGTTYTASITDASTCTSSFSYTTPAPITSKLSSAGPVCNSLSTTISTAGSSGPGTFTYVGPGTMSFTATGGSLYTANASTFGTYKVYYPVSDATCTTTDSLTLTFTADPVGDFTFTDPACGSKSDTITVSTSIGTGTLSFTGPGSMSFTETFAGSGIFKAVVTSFGTYTIKLILDNGSCGKTVSKNVTFTAQPDATVSPSTPACNSLTFDINTASSAGSGSWSTSATGTLSIAANGTNKWIGTASDYGTYSYTWTIVNGSCSATDSKSVTFSKSPQAYAGTDINYCGLSTTFVAVPTVGTGTWTQISGPTIATITDIHEATSIVSSTQYGKYVFRWSEVNGNCPASTDDVEVNFFQDPVGSAGPDQSICGFSTNMQATATVGTGTWSGSGISNTTSPTSPVSAATQGTYTYTWTISNGSCPPLTDQVIIQFFQQPTPNAGPDNAFCGLSGSLAAATPVASGQWVAPTSGVSFSAITSNTSNVTASGYGSYVFVWEESNGACPATTDTVVLTFVETPAPDAGPDQVICGLSANLSAANSAFTGSWTGTGSITSPANRSTGVTVPSYGSYTYKWTEFNASPCPSKADSVKITFQQQPVANAGSDQTVCGLVANLKSTRTVAGSAGMWVAQPGITISNPAGTNPTATASTYGTYYIVWSETNGSVCPTSTDTVKIQYVSPAPPFAGLDQDICGLSTSLHASPKFDPGNWSYTGPGLITFGGLNDTISSIVTNKYGTYYFAWTENTSPCPNNSDTVKINFYEPPVYDAGTSPDKVCGLVYQLGGSKSVGKVKWSWAAQSTGNISFKNGNDSIVNPTVTADTYGTFVFYMTVVNGTCTPPADSVVISFFETPHPDAGPDQEACDTLQQQLNGITSVTGTWQWVGGTGGGTVSFLPDADRPDPIVKVSQPGVYKLFFNETNDPICGTISDSTTITFLELPTADAGADQTACGNTSVLHAAASTVGKGKWMQVASSLPGYTVNFSNDTLNNSKITLSPAPPVSGVTITVGWTVVNGSCPPVYDEVDITFIDVPTNSNAGTDQSLCDLLTTQMNASDGGASGVWTIISGPAGAGAYFVDPNDPVSTFNTDKYGVYILQRTVTVAGCPNGVIDAITVDLRQKPTPDAGVYQILCNDSTSVTAKIPTDRGTGTWTVVSGPGTLNIASPNSNRTLVNLADAIFGTYTLQWEEMNGVCPAQQDQLTLEFQQQVLASADMDRAICGDEYDMNAIPSISPTTSTYTGVWTVLSGTGSVTMVPANGQDPQTKMTVDQFGNYVFVWTENNGICASSTDTVTIQFVNPSNPNAGNDTSYCGLNGNLHAIPSFGVGKWKNHPSNSFQVSFINPADPNSGVISPSYGEVIVVWDESNSPCFAQSDPVTLIFSEQPVANAGADIDVCGLSQQLAAVPSISSPYYQGVWTEGTATVNFAPTPNDSNAFANSSSYGTRTIVWSESNGSCPVSKDTVLITYLQTPATDAGTAPSSVCGKNVQLNAVSTSWPGVWTENGPGTASFTAPLSASTQVTVSNFGSYTFYRIETNSDPTGGSCSSMDSVKVDFFAQPDANAGLDQTVCGDQVQLNGTQSVPGSSIQWRKLGAGTASFNPTGSEDPLVTTSTYGSNQYEITEDVGGGTCIDKDTVTIIHIQQPIANAGADHSTCGLTDSLHALPSVGNGIWSSLQTGVVFNPSLSSPNVKVTASTYGHFGFVWKEDNGAPCSVSRDTVYLDFYKTPLPRAGNDFAICGNSTTLNGVATSGVTGVLNWTYSGTKNVVITNGNTLNPTVTLNPTSSADYGFLNFTLTEDNHGCIGSDAVMVGMFQMPIAVAGIDADNCGNQYVLNATPSVGSGEWKYTGGITPNPVFTNKNASNSGVSVAEFDSYVFYWIEKNPGTCPADTDQVEVNFYKLPVANGGPDTAVCALTMTLTGKASIGNGSWNKISGPGTANFSDINRDTTQVTVSLEGDYIFEWTEVNGPACISSSDRVNVKFEVKPITNAGPDDALCSAGSNLAAVPSGGTGTWTILSPTGSPAMFGDIHSPSSSFTSTQYSLYTLEWNEFKTNVCGVQRDTVVVDLVQSPLADAGTDQMLCDNKTFLNASKSVGIGTWTKISGPGAVNFANPNSAQSLVTIGTSSSDYGTYVFRWTEDNGAPCAPSYDEVSISFYQAPKANAGVDLTICGLDAVLNAIPSVGTGTWQLIASGTQSSIFANDHDPNSQITVNEYGVYQLLWKEMNSAACPASPDVVNVTFLEAPTAFAGNDTSFCSLSGALNAIASAGTGKWICLNNPSAVSFGKDTDPKSTVTTTTYGVYQLLWTEQNQAVCPSSSDIIDVEFVEQPFANAGMNDRVCGLTYKLSAIPSAGIGTWTSSSGASFSPSPNNPNAVATVTTYGNHVFTWTEQNNSPCALSDSSITIEFIEKPTAALSATPLTACAGSSIKLGLDLTGTGPFSITYTANGGSPVTVGNMNDKDSITVTPSVPTTYAITLITDGSGIGCSAPGSNTVFVDIKARPTAQVSGTYGSCTGDSLKIPVTFTGTAPYQASFSNGDSKIFTGNAPYHYTFMPGAAPTITLTSVSDANCTGSVVPGTVNIVRYPLPVVNLSTLSGGKLCDGDSTDLVINISNGSPNFKLYISSNSTQQQYTVSGMNYSQTIHPPVGNTVYKVDSVIDLNGCRGSGNSTPMIVYPNPGVTESLEDPICTNSSSTATFTFTPAGSGPWKVYYNEGGVNDSTSALPSGGNTLFYPSGSTTYNFTRVVDMATGCSSMINDSKKVDVIPTPTLIASSATTELCIGESFYVNLNYSGIEKFSITLDDGSVFSNLRNGDSIKLTPPASRTYTVTLLKDGSPLSCPPNLNFTIPITVNQLPPVSFSYADTASCAPLIVKFDNTTDPNYVQSSNWNFGDGSSSTDEDTQHEYDSQGTKTVLLTVTSGKGCVNSLTRSFQTWIYPDPIAEFVWSPEEPTLVENEVHFYNRSFGAASYSWNIVDTTDHSTDPAYTFPANEPGVYRVVLTAISSYGCIDSTEHMIYINGELSVYIPSAFTPDGDGLNDVFIPVIRNPEIFGYEFLIFDRWGEQIFRSTDPKTGWDGLDAKNDTYVYKLEFKDKYSVERHKYTGRVTRIK